MKRLKLTIKAIFLKKMLQKHESKSRVDTYMAKLLFTNGIKLLVGSDKTDKNHQCKPSM